MLTQGEFCRHIGVKGLIVQPKGFPRDVEEYCLRIYLSPTTLFCPTIPQRKSEIISTVYIGDLQSQGHFLFIMQNRIHQQRVLLAYALDEFQSQTKW